MNLTLSDYANWAQIISIPLAIIFFFFTREQFAGFWKKWLKGIFTVLSLVTIFGLARIGAFNWLGIRVTLPVWALIVASTLLVLVTIAVYWVRNLPDALPNQTHRHWRTYVEDEIFGVTWHWGYLGNSLDEIKGAFCPSSTCKCRLVQDSNFNARAYDAISLVCERCGFKRDFDCGRDELYRKVLREVERRINTGEFTKEVRG